MSIKFGSILDKINPCYNGYRVLYVQNGKQVDKIVDYHDLFAYSEYYLQGISVYEQESDTGLSFALSKEWF